MTFLGDPDGMYHFCGEIVKFSADGESRSARGAWIETI